MLSSGFKDLSKDELLGLVEHLIDKVSALHERVGTLDRLGLNRARCHIDVKVWMWRPALKPVALARAGWRYVQQRRSLPRRQILDPGRILLAIVEHVRASGVANSMPAAAKAS